MKTHYVIHIVYDSDQGTRGTMRLVNSERLSTGVMDTGGGAHDGEALEDLLITIAANVADASDMMDELLDFLEVTDPALLKALELAERQRK